MRNFHAWLLAGTIMMGAIAPSYAYYSKTDYTETFEIGPNQSAFMIPLQGANKDSQVQFGSKDYFQQNKVPAKRVQVPHVKLSGSGGMNDYYVPAAKLIVVDRSPYTRMWTKDTKTGSSATDDGFRFESADSLNIETDVAISASVTEEDAATFLYNFGTPPLVNTIAYDPTLQYQSDSFYAQSYASISYGRSLAQVMDSNVRGMVQVELANAFGSKILALDLPEKANIIKSVMDNVKKFYAVKGITIEYVGYANSLTFDKPVQDAINNVYIATKENEAFAAMAPAIPVRQQIASIGVTENFGKSLSKWNGGLPALPNFAIVPSSVTDWFASFWQTKTVETIKK
jgi:hypothetical protein